MNITAIAAHIAGTEGKTIHRAAVKREAMEWITKVNADRFASVRALFLVGDEA